MSVAIKLESWVKGHRDVGKKSTLNSGKPEIKTIQNSRATTPRKSPLLQTETKTLKIRISNSFRENGKCYKVLIILKN